MRIIGGELKRRLLQAPAGQATRPSSDRLRETLFNILGPSLAGAVFVDAYAGSGAVGIEAWSRGARPVVWIESAPAALAQLRANLAGLGIAGGVVIAGRAQVMLGRLERAAAIAAGGCDIVFFDPPYADHAAYLQLLTGLERRPQLLRPGSRVVVESRRGTEFPEVVGRLRRERVHAVGDSQLVFYALAGGQTARPPRSEK